MITFDAETGPVHVCRCDVPDLIINENGECMPFTCPVGQYPEWSHFDLGIDHFVCVDIVMCPSGQHLFTLDEATEPVNICRCDIPEYIINGFGECMPLECPDGQYAFFYNEATGPVNVCRCDLPDLIINENGECMPLTCPEGQYPEWFNFNVGFPHYVCVNIIVCPGGQHVFTYTVATEPVVVCRCDNSDFIINENGECLPFTCPEGQYSEWFYSDGGLDHLVCLNIVECPVGQHVFTFAEATGPVNLCRCDIQEFIVNAFGECLPLECPDGQHAFFYNEATGPVNVCRCDDLNLIINENGECMPFTCPVGQYPEFSHFDLGIDHFVCVNIVECPVGQHLFTLDEATGPVNICRCDIPDLIVNAFGECMPIECPYGQHVYSYDEATGPVHVCRCDVPDLIINENGECMPFTIYVCILGWVGGQKNARFTT